MQSVQVLNRKKVQDLLREIDPRETMDDDVEEVQFCLASPIFLFVNLIRVFDCGKFLVMQICFSVYFLLLTIHERIDFWLRNFPYL